jgi:hypothetical protein
MGVEKFGFRVVEPKALVSSGNGCTNDSEEML